jgi:protein-arginine kinase
LKTLDEKLKFVRDARLGYLTFCPSKVGTSLRATVQVNIPTLATQSNFQATLDKLKLQATGWLHKL